MKDKEARNEKLKSIRNLSEVCCGELRSVIKILDVIIEMTEQPCLDELSKEAHKARQLAYTLTGSLGTLAFSASEAHEK